MRVDESLELTQRARIESERWSSSFANEIKPNMQSLSIIGMSILASVIYGIFHDQITARLPDAISKQRRIQNELPIQ